MPTNPRPETPEQMAARLDKLARAVFVYQETNDALRAGAAAIRALPSREEREQAWELLTEPTNGDTHEAQLARRLLKLDPTEDK